MVNTGQIDHAEDVDALERTYQAILAATEEDKISLAKSATARQEFVDRVTITRNSMDDCEGQLAKLDTLDLPSEAKCDRCEEMLKELELLLASLQLLESLAREIYPTCSDEDKVSLDKTIQKLKYELEDLMRSLQQKLDILQGVTSAKGALQDNVHKCLDWLNQQKQTLQQVEPVGLDVIEAQQALDQYKVCNKVLNINIYKSGN